MYKIIRMYFGSTPNRVIKTGLTLEQAQAHCRDPETSSQTCKKRVNIRRTERFGPWFDSYSEQSSE